MAEASSWVGGELGAGTRGEGRGLNQRNAREQQASKCVCVCARSSAEAARLVSETKESKGR